MKLPGFPVARAGEIFSSVIARHLARSAGSKIHHLKAFGIYTTAPTSVVPHDLRHLASIMPKGHPWEDDPQRIILDHTLVPLFFHFATPNRAATVLNTIISGDSKNPAATLGLTSNAKIILGHNRKYCPDCLERDLKTYGFSVLYREHQPSFVRMCPVHARPLHFNCLRCQESKKNQWICGKWQRAAHATNQTRHQRWRVTSILKRNRVGCGLRDKSQPFFHPLSPMRPPR
jgi:hypothetical protein